MSDRMKNSPINIPDHSLGITDPPKNSMSIIVYVTYAAIVDNMNLLLVLLDLPNTKK